MMLFGVASLASAKILYFETEYEDSSIRTWTFPVEVADNVSSICKNASNFEPFGCELVTEREILWYVWRHSINAYWQRVPVDLFGFKSFAVDFLRRAKEILLDSMDRPQLQYDQSFRQSMYKFDQVLSDHISVLTNQINPAVIELARTLVERRQLKLISFDTRPDEQLRVEFVLPTDPEPALPEWYFPRANETEWRNLESVLFPL